MAEIREGRRYDLEERTLAFSKRAVKFCRALPKTSIDAEMGKQLMRSSTSVGANYIEANECLGKKDFLNEDQNLPQGGEGVRLLAEAAGPCQR